MSSAAARGFICTGGMSGYCQAGAEGFTLEGLGAEDWPEMPAQLGWRWAGLCSCV